MLSGFELYPRWVPWILTQWIRQRSRDTAPVTTVKTEKQVTLHIYLFAGLGYDFSSTGSQTWLWNERKIRIQAHVGFTATREMKPIINLLRESCILLLFVFMACLLVVVSQVKTMNSIMRTNEFSSCLQLRNRSMTTQVFSPRSTQAHSLGFSKQSSAWNPKLCYLFFFSFLCFLVFLLFFNILL